MARHVERRLPKKTRLSKGAGGGGGGALETRKNDHLDIALVERRTMTPQIFDLLFAAIESWHDGIVRSLRIARINLKRFENTTNGGETFASGLRTAVKKIELESEKIEQAMIWKWLSMHRSEMTEVEEPSSWSNLVCVLSKWRATDQAEKFSFLVDHTFRSVK